MITRPSLNVVETSLHPNFLFISALFNEYGLSAYSISRIFVL